MQIRSRGLACSSGGDPLGTISTFANALSLSLSLAFSFALTADLKSYTKINRRQIEFHPLQQKNNKICFLNWL